MALALPRPFGRYVLTSLIGQGGMAEVYAATAPVGEGLAKRIVIKKIKRELAHDEEFTQMFVDEAKIALHLNHANIVQVFDFGQVDGVFFLAMELVEGIDLMRLMSLVRERGQRFPPVIAAYVAHQATAALNYAHRKTDEAGRPLGIVHRDVSPHNIMVGFQGHVKILDFGIARTKERVAEREVPESGVRTRRRPEPIKGKIAYMSPEQAEGKALDHRSDIYSLGVVMHEMLSGRLVFRRRDRFQALELVRTTPIPRIGDVVSDLDPGLSSIVDRALARDPEARYPAVTEMHAALADYLHHADPVVDDEVLARFVASYAEPRLLELDPSAHSHGRAALAEGETAFTFRPTRERKRVTVLYVALDEAPKVAGEPAPDRSLFGKIVQDLAVRREAQIVAESDRSVLLVFGIPLPTGDDPLRALRAATALQEQVSEMAPGLALGLTVATAKATLQRTRSGGWDVQCSPSTRNQLDRIARSAMDGAIMVTSDLVELFAPAWRLGEVVFIEAESDADGAAGSIPPELEQAFPVLGPSTELEGRAAAPLGGRTRVYGRDHELKTLRDVFSEAIRHSESRAALIVGEPGIGKHALVDRFVASLPRSACFVLRTIGRYSRRNVPFGTFLDMLERFLGVEDETTPETLCARLVEHGIDEPEDLALALLSALGHKAGPQAEMDPPERRSRLQKLVRRLVRSLAQKRPVLLWLENLHFVDEQTWTVLRQWVSVRGPLPFFLLITARPGPRVPQLRSQGPLAYLHLRELDHDARRQLVAQRFEDPEQARALIDAILARTGGHPLFIEETLASLLQRGTLAWNQQGRHLCLHDPATEIDLPPNVEEALQTRLDGLPPPEREALQAASILGRLFRVDELARLVDRDIASELRSLMERNLLELAPQSSTAQIRRARFVTVSFYDVCRSSVPPGLGAALHRKAAQLKLERHDYRPGRDDGPVADHLIAAGDPLAAIDPALRAARDAHEVAGNVEAYYYLSQALRFAPRSDPRAFDALLARESILRRWGRRRAQSADIRRLLQSAEALGDDHRRITATLRLLRYYIELGRLHPAERLLPRVEAALARSLGGIPEHRAFAAHLASALAFEAGRLAEARSAAREALPICADDRRGRRQRGRLLVDIARVELSVGATVLAQTILDEALELARQGKDRELEAEVLNGLGEVAGRTTRYQEAVDLFRAALSIDRDLGDRVATGQKLANLGLTYAAVGLYRRAERCLRKALELQGALGHAAQANEIVVTLGEVLLAMGERDSAHAILEEGERLALRRRDTRTALRAQIRLAGSLGDSSDPAHVAQAKALALRTLEAAGQEGLRTARCRALHLLAKLAVGEGDLERAIAYEEDAVSLIRAGAAPLDGVLSIHHLGLLKAKTGHEAEARALLDEAAQAVATRVAALRDEDLRYGYLRQPKAQEILRGLEPTPGLDAPLAKETADPA